jgi:adenylate cyclase
VANETKLAVILHADIVGSTAWLRIDERSAHDRIQDVFTRFSDLIIQHNGGAHEVRGDAIVAKFERASDAVAAALAFQSANMENMASISPVYASACRSPNSWYV